jgi:hypothetical protein
MGVESTLNPQPCRMTGGAACVLWTELTTDSI